MSATEHPTAPTDLATLTHRCRLPIEVTRLPGLKKLDWILDLDSPGEFIHDLAPHELHTWLRDIGREDAYPLLEFAEPEQLRGLIDIDAWTRHELSVPRFLDWFDLALAADPETAQRFLVAQDDELFLWLMTGDLQVLPNDTELDAIPDSLAFFPTPDGLYLVTVPRGHALEERLSELMKLLWDADMDRARAIFQAAQFELHETVADDLERFRAARLQDMGYEAPSDALAVFSTVPLAALREAVRAAQPEVETRGPSEVGGARGFARDLVLRDVTAPDLLGAALAHLPEEAQRAFGNAAAYLVNKVFMAEVGDLSRLDDLPQTAHYAIGVLNLGLASLAEESVREAARILEILTPETLFQAGWTLIFGLAKRARQLAKRAGTDRGYALFGSPRDEAIAGAATLRPIFPEVLDGGSAVGYRPIRTLDDLALLEAHVHDADRDFSAVARRFGLSIATLEAAELPGMSRDARRRIRLTTLLRTGLVHLVLEQEFRFAPVDRATLGAFARAALAPDGASEVLLRAARTALGGDGVTNDEDRNDSNILKELFAAAINELVSAMGEVAPEDVDLRYAGELFLVADS